MNVKINNKEIETSATNLLQLAVELALPQKGVAMAMDNTMIPRAEWEKTLLKEGADVVIIKAACGG